ncbi:MAG: glycoside hydrolase family 3 C-terminal domain-containing protein [Clostridia bacterium]|nr:glycoside hydrolase family 3 C-terminal domain-containing protein [Clostridia bacterium]
MNVKFLKTLSKILINVFAVLFCLVIVGSSIANEWEGMVNSFLGINPTEVKEKENAEDVDTEYYKSNYSTIADLMEAGKEICAAIEEEGAVLLKNENSALPLAEGSRNVSLFGAASVRPVYSGSGSGSMDANSAATYKSAFEFAGININTALYNWYSNSKYNVKYNSGVGVWSKINEAPYSELPASAKSENDYGDAAIYIVARTGGENIDLSLTTKTGNMFNSGNDFKNGNYLTLNNNEIGVLKALKTLKDNGVYDKIIVILNTANQVEANFINDEEYGVDAAMWIGDVGTSGLNGVAKLLSGEVNPSGKLSETFWNEHRFNPVHANFGRYSFSSGQMATGNSVNNNYVVYQEGIYVGYRYVETRYYDVVTERENAGDFDYDEVVAYPFGYGLSYTTFSYSDYKVKEPAQGSSEFTIKVTITNTGDVDGKEVAQIYLQKPYTEYDIEHGVEKSAIELVGYAKTKVLKPNESQTLTIKVDKKYFASYDASEGGAYVVTPGDYYLAIGYNAHDALNNIIDDNGSFVYKTTESQLDKTTYSKTATNATVTNLFDNADLNRYSGSGGQKINYITRNNWQQTVKFGMDQANNYLGNNVVISKTEQMTKDMKIDKDGLVTTDDIEYPTYGAEKKFNLIDLRVDSNGEKIPYESEYWEQLLDQLTWEDTVELLRNGLRTTPAIQSINKPDTKDHNGPCGIVGGNSYKYGDIDNNYGLAIDNNDPDKNKSPICYPCNGIVAATFNDELVEAMGEMVGEDALWAGYNGLYGTGVNIRRTPYQGRAFEYYSEDALLSGYIGAYVCRGIQSKGCYVYNKHFVLNDQETNRNGICTWANEQTIRENYLRAFEIPVTLAGACNVMTAFNRLGVIWSGAHKGLCTDYLRGEIGMTGFAVTDWYDNNYMGLGCGILAGNDLPDGTRNASELNKYKEGYGELAWAMRESAHRILYTVVHSNAMNGWDSNTEIVVLTPWWKHALTAVQIAVGTVFGLSVLAYAALEVLPKFKKV